MGVCVVKPEEKKERAVIKTEYYVLVKKKAKSHGG